MHGVRSGLLYPKYWLYRCYELQCMCRRLWRQRDDRQLGRMYGVRGGQLQDKRW